MSGTYDADIVVVGGGPAGCAAAVTGARAGLDVVLLEREPHRRFRPGETLHPGVEPLLRRLGVWDSVLALDVLRQPGHWVTWDGPTRFQPYGADADGPWRGLQVCRADLDAALLEQARAAGARVRPCCPVVRAIVRDGRAVGVETSAGSMLARFIVDASGRDRRLARDLALRATPRSPRLLAWYGYAEGECAARDGAPAIVADADGWTWTARVAPGLYQWTRLSIDGARPAVDWRPAELRALQPRGSTRGADVTWRMVERAAGAGYLIAGDAAAVLDPAASHGVLKALMSGMLAAWWIARVVQGDVAEAVALGGYAAQVAAWFEHDVERLHALYSVFPDWARQM